MLNWFAGINDTAWQMAQANIVLFSICYLGCMALISGGSYYGWLKWYEYALGKRMHLGHAFNL